MVILLLMTVQRRHGVTCKGLQDRCTNMVKVGVHQGPLHNETF